MFGKKEVFDKLDKTILSTTPIRGGIPDEPFPAENSILYQVDRDESGIRVRGTQDYLIGILDNQKVIYELLLVIKNRG